MPTLLGDADLRVRVHDVREPLRGARPGERRRSGLPRLRRQEGRRQLSVFATHGTAEQPSFGGPAPAAAVAAEAVAAADPASLELTPAGTPALEAYAADTAACTRCRLAEGRTQVVFGVGDPDADLMFVGEAPGFHEDKQGYPFVGQAGKLLDKLLEGIGLTRGGRLHRERPQVPAAGEPRPAAGRDRGLRGHLFRQLELIQPKLVATLGNFATKLLSGKPHGITRVHGQPQEAIVGGRTVTLYPIYHPAAALYTPAMLRTLEEDFARIPALLGGGAGAPAPPQR